MARKQRPYIRIDQSLGDHPKALQIDQKHYLAAIGLFTVAVGWCDRLRTDGYIPAQILPKLVLGNYKPALAELLRVGFLHSEEDGYRVHDYHDWQDSAEDIDARSRSARESVSRRWDDTKRSTKRNTNRSTECSTERNTHARVSPLPTEPDLSKPNLSIPYPFHADEDVPPEIARFHDLTGVWERAVGSVPSEATKRTLRSWATMGYADAAVEAALKLAIENRAGSPASYATAILRNGATTTEKSEADAYLDEKWGAL